MMLKGIDFSEFTNRAFKFVLFSVPALLGIGAYINGDYDLAIWHALWTGSTLTSAIHGHFNKKRSAKTAEALKANAKTCKALVEQNEILLIKARVERDNYMRRFEDQNAELEELRGKLAASYEVISQWTSEGRVRM